MSRDVVGSFTPNDTPLSNQISGSEKGALVGAWLILLGPVIVGVFFFWHSTMPFFIKPGIPNPFAAILGLVLVLLLIRAIYETIRLKRFGDPVLDLTQVPVPLGGKIEGRVNLGSSYITAPEFALKLQCIQLITRNTGKNNSRTEKILWSSENKTSLLPGGIVPISMAVPEDQMETSDGDPWNRFFWRLTVTAPFPGIKFLEKYEIPVQGRTSGAQRIADGPNSAAGQNSPVVTGRKMFLSTLPFLFVGLAICGWGLYLFSFGLADVTKAEASAGWPTVTGRVQAWVLPPNNAVFVTPPASNFTYTYDVNGTAYSGHTIYPHLFWRTSGVSKLLRGYPVNTPVTVSYSPADPANSCLLAGLRPPACQRLIMAALIVMVGFLFGSTCILAPKYGEMSGNTISYKKGSPASKIMGWTLLLILALGLALWWVT